jgi:hypothetical protein
MNAIKFINTAKKIILGNFLSLKACCFASFSPVLGRFLATRIITDLRFF